MEPLQPDNGGFLQLTTL